MQVKKRLRIMAFVSIATAGIIVLVLLLTLYRVNRAIKQSEIANEIVTSAFERSTYKNDYVRTGAERARIQWSAKHEQIGKFLGSASVIFTDAQGSQNIREMIKDHDSIGTLFSSIVRNRASLGPDWDFTGLSEEIDDRLLSQLKMKQYDVVTHARALRESSGRRLSLVLRNAGWSIIGIVAFVAGAAIINSWMFGRSVALRIGKLRQGAAIVGEGNLDFRIEIKGDDEFTDLSEAFNVMTGKLHRSYCDLENEIAERKRAEEGRRLTMIELERSNKDLEQFAYVASHDLQEPLRIVSNYVQLLETRYKGNLDEKADTYIRFAVDGATRMHNLIEGLLAYSRLAQGTRFKPVEMNSAFAQAIANLEAAIRETGAVVTRDDLPAVRGDETQLMQLLQNLIGNAIKFRDCDQLPVVHVSARRDRAEWVFSVRDNGIGIKPEYYTRIFLIFQRLHTRDVYPGTGIGLSLCQRIVERHGGRIWVESRLGQGSDFFFTIPAES